MWMGRGGAAFRRGFPRGCCGCRRAGRIRPATRRIAEAAGDVTPLYGLRLSLSRIGSRLPGRLFERSDAVVALQGSSSVRATIPGSPGSSSASTSATSRPMRRWTTGASAARATFAIRTAVAREIRLPERFVRGRCRLRPDARGARRADPLRGRLVDRAPGIRPAAGRRGAALACAPRATAAARWGPRGRAGHSFAAGKRRRRQRPTGRRVSPSAIFPRQRSLLQGGRRVSFCPCRPRALAAASGILPGRARRPLFFPCSEGACHLSGRLWGEVARAGRLAAARQPAQEPQRSGAARGSGSAADGPEHGPEAWRAIAHAGTSRDSASCELYLRVARE